MSDLDMGDFEEQVRRGLRRAAVNATATGALDEQFDRRVTRHRRRTCVGVAVLAAAGVVALGAAAVVVSHRSGTTRVAVISGPHPTTAQHDTQPAGTLGWSALPPAPIQARFQEFTVWTGSQLLIWGGAGANDAPASDGAAYDPSTRRWTALPPAPISGRIAPVGVWTGTEALIFGGTTSTSTPSDGAAYNPAERTWRILPAPPLGELTTSGSYAVWTGSQMLAWGFFGSGPGSHGGGSNAAGMFDPATSSWRTGTVAPVAAPLFGDGFWTGKELVVVGASDGSGTTVTQTPVAVAYNPTTDRWRQLPASPLPGGREDMLAAWDGTELVIGGGFNAGRPLNSDAAAYNPTTDTWRRLPDAPQGYSGSNRYPEVWDGQHVVSLEDHDPSSRPLVLDPASGTWTYGPAAPIASVTETPAVWTGHAIIRWGGGTPITGTNSGCCTPVATGYALILGG